MEMGTLSCPGKTFDCDNLALSRDEILSAANECVRTFMGIKEDILDNFGTTGDNKECAVVSNPTYKDESGFKVWAVCCIKHINGSEACKLSCTRYIDNTKTPPPPPEVE
jgi:hypothetical protein